MTSLKSHIAPTLHNAVGGLITAAVLAIIGGAVWFFTALRGISVPLWLALLAVAGWTVLLIALSRKTNQKQSDAIAALQKQHSAAMSDAAREQEQQIAAYHKLASEAMQMLQDSLDKPSQPSSPTLDRLRGLNERLDAIIAEGPNPKP